MIVLTAPTGHIGSKVLAHLLERDQQVRVIARHPEKINPSIREKIEIIEGSHSDARVLDRAFSGADRIFWLISSDPKSPDAEAAFSGFSQAGIDAMKRHQIPQVVGISALGRGWPTDTGYVSATLKLDDRIAETGVAYRALCAGHLMENTLRQVNAIKNAGAFFGATPGDIKCSYVATKDIARLAADLLMDTSWKGVEEIPLKGPAEISHSEMAQIISELLAKPITYKEISLEDLKNNMISGGASQGMAQAMVHMIDAKNKGLDDLAGGPTPRHTPTTFRAWASEVLVPVCL